jgi:hypothetical protein
MLRVTGGLSVVVFEWINLVLDKFWYIYAFLVEGSSKNPSNLVPPFYIRYKVRTAFGHRDFLDHETKSQHWAGANQ